MRSARRSLGPAAAVAMLVLLALAVTCALVCRPAAAAAAPPTAASAPVDADAGVERLKALARTYEGRELLDLLGSAAVRDRLIAEPTESAVNGRPEGAAIMAQALDQARSRLMAIGDPVTRLAGSLDGMRLSGLNWPELWRASALIFLFLLGGVALEALFWLATADWRHHVGAARLDTPRQRASVALQRLGFAVCLVVSFAAGSLGAFLAVRWPPPLGPVALAGLSALVEIRLAHAGLRFLVAPGAERLRILPISTPLARFWYRMFGGAAIVAALGSALADVLPMLGAGEARDAVAALTGLVLTLLAMASVWIIAVTRAHGSRYRIALSVAHVFASFVFPIAWLAFLAGLPELGWFIVIASAVPSALYTARSLVAFVFGTEPGGAKAEPQALHRLAMLVVGIVAIGGLAHAWHLDLMGVGGSGPGARLVRSVLQATAILLAADLVWQVVRASIDRRLVVTGAPGDGTETDLQRAARLRTVLPALRTVVLTMILTLAGLSALSALGVEIGPLLAGAGIVGIAVGLGAQALVRDVISGLFFLLEDAFRVGDYVESGTLSGTVESFTLRSLKLRHYRGQLQVVPFGDLKTVTNYSRSWMAAELQLVVPFSADLDAVEAVLRDVSDELMHEAELQGAVIEPLTSFGVGGVTENGLRVSALMKVRAGKQFAAQRLAYAAVKRLFEARGIAFATPRLELTTVGVPTAVPPARPATPAPAAALSGEGLDR